jgi:hypothetical protein
LFGVLLLYTAVAHAQTPVNTLPELLVELWPDYDEPSVLVLLTGALPADAVLPATLTLPLPEGAVLNAVASIDATGAMLNTDYTAASGFVTLTTPDPRFRVEYYVPYRVTGAERAYTFRWEAGLDVAQLTLRVQEPAAAANLTITPAAERSVSIAATAWRITYWRRSSCLPDRRLPLRSATRSPATFSRRPRPGRRP